MTTTAPTAATDTSRDPRTGAARGEVPHTEPREVAGLALAAAGAATEVAATPPARRADWLEQVAATLEEHRQELAELADQETALGMDRLLGEVGRAAAQARFYGSVAVDGGYAQASIDHLDGVGDIRRARLPMGPVAVTSGS